MNKKTSFMIYTGFQSVLVQEYNEKPNLEESYIYKYQKHLFCNHGCKLVCVDDKFSKPFKSNFGKDSVYNFINCMIEERKYCSDETKKHFNKELVVTRQDSENFKNYTKSWIYDFDYVENDVKV